MTLTRRALLSSAAGAAAPPRAPRLAFAQASGPPSPGAANAASDALLDEMAEALMVDYPENASFLGLDSGPRAGLKRRLTDRSLAGDAVRAASCTERLGRLKAVDRSRLSGLSAVNYDCALYAFQLAADGYAGFRYGDNAVLNTLQAESNTPYVVNQDTGDFSSIPDFLDSQHKIETAADADAYLARKPVIWPSVVSSRKSGATTPRPASWRTRSVSSASPTARACSRAR